MLALFLFALKPGSDFLYFTWFKYIYWTRKIVYLLEKYNTLLMLCHSFFIFLIKLRDEDNGRINPFMLQLIKNFELNRASHVFKSEVKAHFSQFISPHHALI
jgi:hypothetical protein